MELTDDKLILHVTSIGGCIRREMLELHNEPVQDFYYHSTLGKYVHSMMEKALIHLAEYEEMLNIDEVFEESLEEFGSFGMDYKHEIMERVLRGWKWLIAEQDNLKGNIMEVENTHYLPTGFVIDGKDVVISGTPDLIIMDNVPTIIDFKSGKSRNKKQAWQVAAYSAMHMNDNHEGDELTPEYRARIVYLGIEPRVKLQKNGKVHKYHERSFTFEDLKKYVMEWHAEKCDYIARIKESYPEVPDPYECSDCYFCPYRSLDWGQDFGGR